LNLTAVSAHTRASVFPLPRCRLWGSSVVGGPRRPKGVLVVAMLAAAIRHAFAAQGFVGGLVGLVRATPEACPPAACGLVVELGLPDAL
jgi:hypothetical protein